MTTEAETECCSGQPRKQGVLVNPPEARKTRHKEGFSSPGFRGGMALQTPRFWTVVSRTVRE